METKLEFLWKLQNIWLSCSWGWFLPRGPFVWQRDYMDSDKIMGGQLPTRNPWRWPNIETPNTKQRSKWSCYICMVSITPLSPNFCFVSGNQETYILGGLQDLVQQCWEPRNVHELRCRHYRWIRHEIKSKGAQRAKSLPCQYWKWMHHGLRHRCYLPESRKCHRIRW